MIGYIYNNIIQLWYEVSTPSEDNEGSYKRLLIAVGHACVAAAVVEWYNEPLLVALAYLIIKEVFWDIVSKGGSIKDSIHDALFITIGCYISGTDYSFSLIMLYATLSALLWRNPK